MKFPFRMCCWYWQSKIPGYSPPPRLRMQSWSQINTVLVGAHLWSYQLLLAFSDTFVSIASYRICLCLCTFLAFLTNSPPEGLMSVWPGARLLWFSRVGGESDSTTLFHSSPNSWSRVVSWFEVSSLASWSITRSKVDIWLAISFEDSVWVWFLSSVFDWRWLLR